MPANLEQHSIVVNARFVTQPITGVQRFAAEICLRLKALLPDVVFVAPRNVEQTEIAQQLQVTSFGRFTSHLWEQIELPLYLKSKNYPLLLNLCNTAPLYHKRNIICIHDIAFAVNPKWFNPVFVALYKFLIPRISKKSLKVLTVSSFSKSEITKYTGIASNKIEVVYNGLTNGITEPNNLSKHPLYGKYILAVSSVDPRKNLISLVKAFKEANIPDLKLIIVGSASKVFANDGLKEEIENCPAVIFTGYLPDFELASVYRQALIFVYPSLYEGFGIPPLEAMANGVPTIVSNTAALPEICGDASLYINPLDVKEIAVKIKLMMENEGIRQTFIQKGYLKAGQYSWTKSALQVAQVLKVFR